MCCSSGAQEPSCNWGCRVWQPQGPLVMGPGTSSLPAEASVLHTSCDHDQLAAMTAGFGTPKDLAHRALQALKRQQQLRLWFTPLALHE